jgi:hypothetical protein
MIFNSLLFLSFTKSSLLHTRYTIHSSSSVPPKPAGSTASTPYSERSPRVWTLSRQLSLLDPTRVLPRLLSWLLPVDSFKKLMNYKMGCWCGGGSVEQRFGVERLVAMDRSGGGFIHITSSWARLSIFAESLSCVVVSRMQRFVGWETIMHHRGSLLDLN